MNDVSKWNEIADIFLLALNKYIEVRLGRHCTDLRPNFSCTHGTSTVVAIAIGLGARSRLDLALDRAAADRDGYVRQARRGSAHAAQDSQPQIRRLQSLLESARQTPRRPRPLKPNTGLDLER